MKWLVLLVLVVIVLAGFGLWRRMQALPSSSAAEPAIRPLGPSASGPVDPDPDVDGPSPSSPESRTPR